MGPSDLATRHRLRWWEALPWLAAIAVFFAFPTYLAFATQLLITILFALSLDLVLGYAGIVTLGHAAFFGAGAYTVGMLAIHAGWNEPLSGLVAAAIVAGVGLTGCPNRQTSPARAATRPNSTLSRVDLPAPLWPTRQSISLARRLKSSPVMTTRPS